VVRIESESLPTGIAIPQAGHISIPIAFTPSNSAWSASKVDLKDAIFRVLKNPTVASKSFLITIGDRSIQISIGLMPGSNEGILRRLRTAPNSWSFNVHQLHC